MDKDLLLKRIRTLTHPVEPISLTHTTRMRTLKNIHSVAFDFYGTMFISAVGDIGVDEEQQNESPRCFIDALEDSGFTINDNSAGMIGVSLFEDTVARYIADAQRQGIDYPEPDIISVWGDVLAEMGEQEIIGGSIDRKASTRFGIEFEFRINNIWPVPQLENLLRDLLDRNLELGIISNSQYYTPLAFEAFMNRSPAEFGFNPNLLVWSYKTGRKKPSVAFYRIFRKAAEQEGLQPDEILYVGNDIRKDIEPAKQLGMKTALYVGDQRSIRHDPEEFEKNDIQPDLVIDELAQISECLVG